MMKIYIAGCGGMLGDAFYRQFSPKYTLKCSDIQCIEPWLSCLDFRDFGAYRADVISFKPDYLFHLGALTDLEFCERHPDEAHATNTLGVENATHIANELGVPLLYISTAGIFDGAKAVYDDWDQPNPLGHYARSKYAGEFFVQKHVPEHLICRAGWMMGGGPRKDKKFIQKIMRQLKAGKRELTIVNDKAGTPTYTHDFARNTALLIEKEQWGLYNMVCEGETDRLEVTREIISILGLKEQVSITEVTSSHFCREYFAPRPTSERLRNSRLRQKDLNIMRHWKVGLREYLSECYSDYLA